MDLKDLKVCERKHIEDLVTYLDLFDLEDMDSIAECNEGIQLISECGVKYRHVHVELKCLMGDEEHKKMYDKYAAYSLTVTKYVKAAKAKVKELTRKVREDEESDAQGKARHAVLVKVNVLHERLTDEDLKVGNVFEGKASCEKYDQVRGEYYNLLSEAKIVYGNAFDADCKPALDAILAEIQQQSLTSRTEIARLKQAEETDKIQKAEAEKKDAEDKFLKIESRKAKILSDEIKFRCDSLEKQCDIATLDDLDDSQIFERNKYLSTTLAVELRDISNRFSEFSKIVPTCGDSLKDLSDSTGDRHYEAISTRNEYAQELYKLLTTRNITEETLRRSQDIVVELPKFKGYDSKHDIYSFRHQFEKLIQPGTQKKFWVDSLKTKYLAGPAFTLVEKIENIDEIWEKLIESYGNVKLLLQNKIGQLDKLDNLSKARGDENIANILAKLLNLMTELSTLATKYDLENKLYVGGGLEKMYSLIGEDRERRFLKKNMLSELSSSTSSESKDSDILPEKAEWENLKKFLKDEHHLREKYVLLEKSKNVLGIKPKEKEKKDNATPFDSTHVTTELNCHLCGKSDHVVSTDLRGNKHIDYVACEAWTKKSPKERRMELLKKKFCFACLTPGVIHTDDHTCHQKYVCPHASHNTHKKGLHVLVCQAHMNDEANVETLEKYKNNFVFKRSRDFKNFTRELSLTYFSKGTNHSNQNNPAPGGLYKEARPDVKDSPIYLFQTINIDGNKFNLFFDNGGGKIIVRKSALEILKKLGRAICPEPGPSVMYGVGGVETVCEDGVYDILLPLRDGTNATLNGVCMETITTEFPKYPLSDVERDIYKECQDIGGEDLVSQLPKLSDEVGGQTDILIGIKYLMYHPELIYRLPSGLSIFVSQFLSADGTTGVVGGPHPKFTEVERGLFSSKKKVRFPSDEGNTHVQGSPMLSAYLTQSAITYRSNFEALTESPLVCEESMPDLQCQMCESQVYQHQIPCSDPTHVAKRPPKGAKTFDEVDTAGTEVLFRCEGCKNCETCKTSQRVDDISIADEAEQQLIQRCVTVDIEECKTSHVLPFVVNPDTRIDQKAQERMAIKVYNGVIKSLNDEPSDKAAVIKSEKKLHDLGFVDYVDNLPEDIQKVIAENVKYIIPWRINYNGNSVTTPVRVVFDGRACPKGSININSMLAKGTNNMNNLVSIMIRFQCYKHVFHTDISKMYNTIYLDKKHWRYQLYYWDEELRLGVAPRLKAIKTAIYGIRPSGNVAEYGLRKTAELTKSIYPKAYNVVMKDIYVDDCLSGCNTPKERSETTDQLSCALAKGGFKLKGITLSGSDPPENLANDDKISVNTGGVTFFPKEDKISIKIPDINFGKKCRGRKNPKAAGIIPDKLTKRQCVGVVYEIFDIVGKIAPLIASFKLDIRDLSSFEWDEVLPENFRRVWESNIEMMQEIRNIRYQRAVIPEDAVDLSIETIDTADASQTMICVAIYVRFKLRSGGYSCQLLFARTKIVPKDMSQPRAELLAALLNTHTGHIVKTSLGERHKAADKLTDSQVALFWLTSERCKLKLWVRNRVKEILRLSDVDSWKYVSTKDMIADLGTRKGATIDEVGPDSPWINGFEWMRGEKSLFPVMTASEIILSAKMKQEALKECVPAESLLEHDLFQFYPNYVPHTVKDYYKFSKYVIDPNRFRFKSVVRVLSLVLLFIKNIRNKLNKPALKIEDGVGEYDNRDLYLTQGLCKRFLVTIGNDKRDIFKCQNGLVVVVRDELLHLAQHYFFRKASEEVKHFFPDSKYKNLSVEKSGVLYFAGRILPTQEIGKSPTLCDVSFDLTQTTFCVPIMSSHSPIAYALCDEIHWYHPEVMHRGVETLIRHTYKVAYIIGGRSLITTMKDACERCRFLLKKEVQVAMGPKDDSNLCIAPAFYNTQVDLFGPFDSYSNANKRATIKVWFSVFCCSTTGAIDVKILEDYSTDSFVLAFIRFSCRYGYPLNLYPDAGSQLLKGSKDMVISFQDIKWKLELEFGIQFYPCPVASHYVHGKVERKIGQIKESVEINLRNRRLSIIQWETLMHQIANSINNLPIGVGNKTWSLENLDLITPNRLILGRNNNRCPTAPLVLSNDVKKIISTNEQIFKAWFDSWLLSYVPTLVPQPKWFVTNRNVSIGDVVVFSKSEKDFENTYQFGMVVSIHPSKDGLIRSVDIEYQNHNENVKRQTKRGVREIVVIHPVEELGISRELYDLSQE